jgi:hypothetical protein
MVSSEIKLTPKSLFGYVLFFLGLILLGYVVMNAIYLASGVFQPLRVQFTDPSNGRALITSVETQVFFGITIQIGMYALMIAVASILMKYGLSIARKEK